MKIKKILESLILTGALVGQIFGQANPDASFEERCNADGVLHCFGFDTPQLHGQVSGTATFTDEIKVSGEGSMHVPMPPSAGMVIGNVVVDLGATFGEGSSLYMQWRQRFSESYTTEDLGGDGVKQVVIYDDQPCCEVEVAMLNWEYRGFPQFYTNVMQNWFYKDLGGGDVAWQYNEEEIICTESDPSTCDKYLPDEWMTFSYEMHIGDWGEPNSVIKAAWAPEGKPLKTYVYLDDWEFNQDTPGPDNAFRTAWIGPFSVDRTAGGNPDAETWYDEFIISTEPIADPNESPVTHVRAMDRAEGKLNIQLSSLNNLVNISWLEIRGSVDVSIYSSQGKRLTRFTGNQPGKVVWDASDQSSGVYLVELNSGYQTYRKKFSLIR